MEKIIKIVNKEKNIVQITSLGERWYGRESKHPETGLPYIEFVPSITYITSFYPKSQGYMRWLAAQGWDTANEIRNEAGDRGTVVHHAIAHLLAGGSFKMDEKVPDRDGVMRELTPDEYYCVMTFLQWYEEVGRPKAVEIERTVWSLKHGYAGTLDILFESGLLVDIKTGKDVWPSHVLQVSALRQACIEEGLKVEQIAILQVGYLRNKTKHYKLTEVADQFPLFLSVKEIWNNECSDDKPLQRDMPLALAIPKESSIKNVSRSENDDSKVAKKTKK